MAQTDYKAVAMQKARETIRFANHDNFNVEDYDHVETVLAFIRNDLSWLLDDSTTRDPMDQVIIRRKDAENLARFGFNNAGNGLRSNVKDSALRVFDALVEKP